MNKFLIIRYLFTFCASISCTLNLDDPISKRLYREEKLTEDFMLNENWFLKDILANQKVSVNGNAESTNIYEQILNCEKDNFYVFMNNSSVVLNQSELICNNEVNQSFNFKLDRISKTLKLDKLIGGFTNQSIISELQFLTLIEEDEIKIIKSSFNTIIDNKEVSVEYILSNKTPN